MASQDETTPKVNRLALDEKFACFSLLLTYDCFKPDLPDGFIFHTFLFALYFCKKRSIHSFAFIKYLSSCFVHKTLILAMPFAAPPHIRG